MSCSRATCTTARSVCPTRAESCGLRTCTRGTRAAFTARAPAPCTYRPGSGRPSFRSASPRGPRRPNWCYKVGDEHAGRGLDGSDARDDSERLSHVRLVAVAPWTREGEALVDRGD